MALAHSPLDTLWLFPNIDLMVVVDLTRFNVVDALPDTITGVVLREVNFWILDPSTLKFPDRVVEVHCWYCTHDTPADLELFSNRSRLNVFAVSRCLSLPQEKPHRLR